MAGYAPIWGKYNDGRAIEDNEAAPTPPDQKTMTEQVGDACDKLKETSAWICNKAKWVRWVMWWEPHSLLLA